MNSLVTNSPINSTEMRTLVKLRVLKLVIEIDANLDSVEDYLNFL